MKNSIKNIVVMSDSWAWCWYAPRNFIHDNDEFFNSTAFNNNIVKKYNAVSTSFPMLQLLLESYGYIVTNLGRPGSSNLYQVEVLKELLSNTNEQSTDAIVLLQTDPLRDVYHGLHPDFGISTTQIDWEKDLTQRIDFGQWTPEYLESLLNHTIQGVYRRIVGALQEHNLNIPVLILGGCGTVQPHLVQEVSSQTRYSGLHVVSPSVVATASCLLTGSTGLIPHPAAFNRVACYSTPDWNPALTEFLYQIDINQQRWHGDLDRVLWPDRAHPSASAWVAIVEYLAQYIDTIDC